MGFLFLTMTMADIFDLPISLNFKPKQHENREAAEVHISHKRCSIKKKSPIFFKTQQNCNKTIWLSVYYYNPNYF